jgi:hypothetical protein
VVAGYFVYKKYKTTGIVGIQSPTVQPSLNSSQPSSTSVQSAVSSQIVVPAKQPVFAIANFKVCITKKILA